MSEREGEEEEKGRKGKGREIRKEKWEERDIEGKRE